MNSEEKRKVTGFEEMKKRREVEKKGDFNSSYSGGWSKIMASLKAVWYLKKAISQKAKINQDRKSREEGLY